MIENWPTKKYNVIYADPAWFYDNHSSNGFAESHYKTMKIDQIKALPVAQIADNPCALFLWVIFPCLPDCIEVMKSWGFTYKTLAFSWIKLNRNNSKPFIGTGNYTRANCEVCLLGVKGNVMKLKKSSGVSSAVITTRQEHSKKPAIVRDRIVQLFGDVPRIELFARQKVPGWDAWGNEVEEISPLEAHF